MNVVQKCLTVVALAGFVGTICFAPWRWTQTQRYNVGISPDGRVLSQFAKIQYAPIWKPQVLSSNTGSNFEEQWEVAWQKLLCYWFALAIVYAGLFLVFQNARVKSGLP